MSDGWIIDVIERAGLNFHLGTVVEAVCVAARDLEGSVRLDLLDRAQDHLGREIRRLRQAPETAPAEASAAAPEATVAEAAPVAPEEPKAKAVPKATKVKSLPPRNELKVLVGRLQKYFDAHPGASWRQAFQDVPNNYKSSHSLSVCVREYVTRASAKAGRKPQKRGVPRKRRNGKTTVQKQALNRLREEALRTAVLDGIEFPDDESREEYIEQFVANC